MQMLYRPEIRSLRHSHSGKVREMYALDDAHMLIVTTDRISAFDVVLSDPVPGKGEILTAVSNFWFARTQNLIANHLADIPLRDVISDRRELAQLRGRSVVVRTLHPLPVEAIVRGYLAGSGWKEYQATGRVCGITLPAGLPQAARLPTPIFTPSTKARVGQHDENIDFSAAVALLGEECAQRMRRLSLQIYAQAAAHAERRGIIIADTKFEFGLNETGELALIDELLTPDSSRFWPRAHYRTGCSPTNFDKQFVRDYLDDLGWDKRPPAPQLPQEVIRRTAERYREARERLLGD